MKHRKPVQCVAWPVTEQTNFPAFTSIRPWFLCLCSDRKRTVLRFLAQLIASRSRLYRFCEAFSRELSTPVRTFTAALERVTQAMSRQQIIILTSSLSHKKAMEIEGERIYGPLEAFTRL